MIGCSFSQWERTHSGQSLAECHCIAGGFRLNSNRSDQGETGPGTQISQLGHPRLGRKGGVKEGKGYMDSYGVLTLGVTG